MAQESKLEKRIREYAIKNGILTWKLTSTGTTAVQDRIFMYSGVTVFIECKAPGEKLRPQQIYRIVQLLRRRMLVSVVDNFKDGKAILDHMLLLKPPSKTQLEKITMSLLGPKYTNELKAFGLSTTRS